MFRRLGLTAAVSVLLVSTLLGQHAPLPERLLNAKTAFVMNDGTASKVFDKFYVELEKWGHFRIVQAKTEADVIIVLSSRPGELGGAVAMAGGTSGVVIAGSESRFYIRITDAEDATPLWSDNVGEATLVSNSAKKLVKNLKERVDRQKRTRR